jgi:hypothetical protein
MAKKPEVNKGGRPREHDREQIALDLVEWAKSESSINFNKFCCTREPPIPASKLLQWAKECDEFRAAYETAKAFLGCRREEWLSSERLHVKAYDLNATVYDLIAKDEKMEMSKYDSNLRKQEDNKPTEVIVRVDGGGIGSGSGVSTKRISTSIHKGSK